MTWTPAQLLDVQHEYARIGYVDGERWPAPPPELLPDALLALLREVPDAAGLAGWRAALRRVDDHHHTREG